MQASNNIFFKTFWLHLICDLMPFHWGVDIFKLTNIWIHKFDFILGLVSKRQSQEEEEHSQYWSVGCINIFGAFRTVCLSNIFTEWWRELSGLNRRSYRKRLWKSFPHEYRRGQETLRRQPKLEYNISKCKFGWHEGTQFPKSYPYIWMLVLYMHIILAHITIILQLLI